MPSRGFPLLSLAPSVPPLPVPMPLRGIFASHVRAQTVPIGTRRGRHLATSSPTYLPSSQHAATLPVSQTIHVILLSHISALKQPSSCITRQLRSALLRLMTGTHDHMYLDKYIYIKRVQISSWFRSFNFPRSGGAWDDRDPPEHDKQSRQNPWSAIAR